MKKLLIALTLTLAASSAYAATAYFSHESNSGGLTKQCHYKYLSEMYSITVRSTKICPLTIEV
jgi:hypothetical protein